MKNLQGWTYVQIKFGLDSASSVFAGFSLRPNR